MQIARMPSGDLMTRSTTTTIMSEDAAEDPITVEYDFITGEVPRYNFKDPVGLNLIKQQVPVILTGSDLVAPAMKWDLDYLSEHLGPGPFSVFMNNASPSSSSSSSCRSNNVDRNSNGIHDNNGTTCASSQTDDDDDDSMNGGGKKLEKKAKIRTKRHNLFKYFDQKKANEFVGEFVPEITREDMSFEDFLAKYNGDRRKERVYFQQPLNNTVGRQIATDFVKFNWSWNIKMSHEWSWGPLTSNLLLIGQKGNVTPCHYDEQQNLFCQLHGQKKFFLFAPENFPCLYPYPVHHPHDRQSQVDFDYPDLVKFPKYVNARGVKATIQPGEILYIPMYWWHHVINMDDTIAINFWHKDGANSPIEYPLKSFQKVAMVRNIEKMLLQALQDQNDLQTILHWLVDGRF